MFKFLKRLHIRALKPSDTAELVSLEKNLFEPEQCNGFDEIDEILSECNEYEGKICSGLFNYRQMVGYYLSYPHGSKNDPNSEDEAIIFISDVAVLPEYRKYTYKLISTAISDTRRYYPDRPIEHYCTLKYRRHWVKHQQFFHDRLGFRLVRNELCQETTFSKDLYWLRWQYEPKI